VNSAFALVDCENFYVSCERVFDPSLRARPVVVLSNNDGCVIARSQAVKDAGVPMGAPYFQWEEQLAAMGAVVRSSNYALYGDMSWRVMRELEQMALRLERYSIDEAFLTLPDLGREELRTVAHRLQQRVARRQGVPIRVGIGPTKTLAKVADEKAKGNRSEGAGALPPPGRVYVCPDGAARTAMLRTVPVGELWGIGSAWGSTLREHGIETAEQLRRQPDAWLRRTLTVVGLRLATELRGTPCLELEDVPETRKSLIRSRSFSERVTDESTLREAISKHTQRAAEKLRAEDLVAGHLEVFITTKRFGDPPHYSNAAGGTLRPLTHHTPTLLGHARRLLRAIYRDGPAYKKAGVALQKIRPETPRQGHLFGDPDPADAALMETVDHLNRTMGRGTVGFAAAGVPGNRTWTMKREQRSPHYTTRWSDLPVARAEEERDANAEKDN
jgi:DNA polymerase V